ncbi:MAG: PIG-L family deacetylase [bacterium]
MKQLRFKILLLLFSFYGLTFLLIKSAVAQNEPNFYISKGYLTLYQAVTDLKSDFTLMSVAAHPDDEDVETLTYYRRKKGVRSVVVVATRGEGGQNEIGPELYRDLGVIRTHEMWRAGAITGAEYYNLNLEDFGYSKTSAETFEKWGRQKALRALVYLIRKLKPEVIITNHDTRTGHGHHQALGILIRRAFELAGDRSKFPEQLRNGLSVWRPRRLFQRLWQPENADVCIPVGQFDAVWGESYAQMAARALREHRSQGMQQFAKRIKRGPRVTYYRMINSIEGNVPKGDELFAELPDVFKKLKANSSNYPPEKINQLEKIRQQTVSRIQKYPAELKLALVNELALWRRLQHDLRRTSQFSSSVKKQISKLEKALFHALSLDFSISLSDEKVVRGQNIQIKAILFNGGQEEVILKSVRVLPGPEWFGDTNTILSKTLETKLSYNQSDTTLFDFGIPETAKFTVPKTEVYYQTAHWQPLLEALIEYEYHGVTSHARTEVHFDVVPDLEVKLVPSKAIVPLSLRGFSRYFVVQIINNRPDSAAGEVRLEWETSPPTNDKKPLIRSWSLRGESEETALRFEVNIPARYEAGDYHLRVNVNGNENDFQTSGLVRLIDVLTVPGLKVGLVKSYDNTLQDALNQLGIENQLLASDDLQWGDLSQFDTIILDMRAYLVRESLRKNNARILDYVKKGGNLVVMYQKLFEWNPEYGNPPWAPFSLLLSRKRVTDENAPVEILAPGHPLLNVPNKITKDDWAGWVQERGLYFPTQWAANYEPLLSMSDPGEPPLVGGFLVAKFGKGTYIYTSLVWYRQLRALVPGAYRSLANMVGYARAKLND